MLRALSEHVAMTPKVLAPAPRARRLPRTRCRRRPKGIGIAFAVTSLVYLGLAVAVVASVQARRIRRPARHATREHPGASAAPAGSRPLRRAHGRRVGCAREPHPAG